MNVFDVNIILNFFSLGFGSGLKTDFLTLLGDPDSFGLAGARPWRRSLTGVAVINLPYDEGFTVGRAVARFRSGPGTSWRRCRLVGLYDPV
jgi:hypothetical protein